MAESCHANGAVRHDADLLAQTAAGAKSWMNFRCVVESLRDGSSAQGTSRKASAADAGSQVRNADRLVHHGHADADIFFSDQPLKCPGRTRIAAFEAQRAAFLARKNIRRVSIGFAVGLHLNTARWTDRLAQVAMNAAGEKVWLGQRSGWAETVLDLLGDTGLSRMSRSTPSTQQSFVSNHERANSGGLCGSAKRSQKSSPVNGHGAGS